MLVHPDINPVAVKLGPLSVHWYGLMYLIGFWGGWWLLMQRLKTTRLPLTRDIVNDLVFYVVMGVILGGRIGYTFFYNVDAQGSLVFLHDPLVILRIWEGGMSFHGGLIGVVTAFFLFARRYKLHFFDIADYALPAVPVGLFTGRLGNFINGELWGAPTDLPWGMVFQHAPDSLPRHPSMLYEAGLEGLALFAVLFWFSGKPRPRMAVSGLFLVLYALFRTLVETVREPDRQIGYLFGTDWFTMGMLLCVPMWLTGAAFLAMAYRKKA